MRPGPDLVTGEVVVRTTAMASAVQVRLASAGADPAKAREAADRALEVFHEVDRTCTRFSPDSDLMRANAAPTQWTAVSRTCFDALVEAHAAYRRTNGRFDPRVLADLVRLGYDRSMTLGPPSPRSAEDLRARNPLPAWQPEFRRDTFEVRLGEHAIDLGGIGKGLAVRWAGYELGDLGVGFLIDAGGDCLCRGRAADGDAWRIAVEHPRRAADPVAVLAVSDEAVATSSVRVRTWQVAGADVHHLIDPADGRPGGQGLKSVTVIDADPAAAEVWSKTLFLTGRRGIRTSAEHFGVRALWVDGDDGVAWTTPMNDHVLWREAS